MRSTGTQLWREGGRGIGGGGREGEGRREREGEGRREREGGRGREGEGEGLIGIANIRADTVWAEQCKGRTIIMNILGCFNRAAHYYV